jgi:hypothetical protein
MMGEKIVTYQEQIDMGLIKPKGAMVQAAPSLPVVRRMPPSELNNVTHTIDVAPSAQHIVEMKTSAVDRSKGFLIATVPLFGAFALGAMLISCNELG